MVIKRSIAHQRAVKVIRKASAEVVVAAGDFKARCLKILDDVSSSRQGIVITKHGRPVARVVPIEDVEATRALKGSVVYEGDLISPTGESWSASS